MSLKIHLLVQDNVNIFEELNPNVLYNTAKILIGCYRDAYKLCIVEFGT